jgi:hypothetical protein
MFVVSKAFKLYDINMNLIQLMGWALLLSHHKKDLQMDEIYEHRRN